MKRTILLLLPLGALLLAFGGHNRSTGQFDPSDAPEKKFPDFNSVVKGAKEHDGLFKLFHREDKLYAEIRLNQFEQPFLCPIAIARGLGMGGFTRNFEEQWVL